MKRPLFYLWKRFLEVGINNQRIPVGCRKIHGDNTVPAMCIIGEVGIDLWINGIGYRGNAWNAEDERFVTAGEIDIQHGLAAIFCFCEKIGDTGPFPVIIGHYVLVLHTEGGIGVINGKSGVILSLIHI